MAPEISTRLRRLNPDAPNCVAVLGHLCELKVKCAWSWSVVDFVPMAVLHFSKSCFDFFDFQVANAPIRRLENSHIVIPGRPNIRIGRTEKQNALCAGGRSEMGNSTVMSDKHRPLKDSG